MRRPRRHLLLAFAAALAAPRPLFAQAGKQLPRVAVLFEGTAATARPNAEPFMQGLQSLGYDSVWDRMRDLVIRTDAAPADLASNRQRLRGYGSSRRR